MSRVAAITGVRTHEELPARVREKGRVPHASTGLPVEAQTLFRSKSSRVPTSSTELQTLNHAGGTLTVLRRPLLERLKNPPTPGSPASRSRKFVSANLAERFAYPLATLPACKRHSGRPWRSSTLGEAWARGGTGQRRADDRLLVFVRPLLPIWSVGGATESLGLLLRLP